MVYGTYKVVEKGTGSSYSSLSTSETSSSTMGRGAFVREGRLTCQLRGALIRWEALTREKAFIRSFMVYRQIFVICWWPDQWGVAVFHIVNSIAQKLWGEHCITRCVPCHFTKFYYAVLIPTKPKTFHSRWITADFWNAKSSLIAPSLLYSCVQMTVSPLKEPFDQILHHDYFFLKQTWTIITIIHANYTNV